MNYPTRRPHWARLPDGDTDYSDWQIDIKFSDKITRAHVNGDGVSNNYGYDGYDGYDGNGNGNSNDYGNGNDDDDGHDYAVSYLVHRYAIGPQCNYFADVFGDTNGFSESYEKRSILEFPVDDTKSGTNNRRQYFEDLLDFLYDTRDDEKKMEFEMDNIDKALAMLGFADCLGIDTIRGQALEFLRTKIITSENSSTSGEWLAKIYIAADRVSIEELQDTIAKTILCCNSSNSNTTDEDLFVSFLRCLRSSPESQRKFVHRMFRDYQKTDENEESASSGYCFLSLAIDVCPDMVDKDVFSEC